MNLVMVTGGIRSGKTDYSERYLLENGSSPFFYLPTALPGDPLWESRISLHQEKRESRFMTLEIEPAALLKTADTGEILKEHVMHSLTVGGSLLLDSLGLFVAACLGETDAVWQGTADELLARLRQRPQLTVLVAEEVGMALVPGTREGRLFTDRLGEIRQAVAALAGEVIFILSGLPLVLKSESR
ncbi:MAG: bifunctional adenosylcobinamide kinase/adenosylcobinamide-phosphate guanylyltransferase [Leptospirillum sp.]|jgi:adenosylcobinamide kinase/adenosylcobinamide-phosphate guanylyltransferase